MGSPDRACRTNVGNDHAISAGLAWAHRVEEPHDDDRLLALTVVGQRQELVDGLAARIRPAVFERRTHDQVRILAERHGGVLPVHLGRRKNHGELALLARVLQHDLGAVDVGFDGPHRRFDDELDADRSGQVEHHVGAVDELGREPLVHDRVDRVLEPGSALEVGDVVHGAGREVVDDRDAVSLIEEWLGQV